MNRKELKNELFYLWADFKWPLLAAFLILAVAAYHLFFALNEKETVLSVMLIDCHTDISPEQMEKEYLAACGYDPGRQQAEILTNLLFSDTESGSYTMTSLSRFLADIGSEKLDVCGMLESDFIKYDHSETWLDLREILDADVLAAFGENLLTSDGRVIGIYADALPAMQVYGCYETTADRGVLGILYNAPHREAAREYLLFAAGTAPQS